MNNGMVESRTEVEELKKKLGDLTLSKNALETQLSDTVRSQQTCQDKITNLLNDNSQLVTERDSLASTVKTQNGEIVEVKKAMAEIKEKGEEVAKSLGEEKETLAKELSEVKESLSVLEDESLKLFEEGYHECCSRAEARSLDMEPYKFENYLADLKERVKKGVEETVNLDNWRSCR